MIARPPPPTSHGRRPSLGAAVLGVVSLAIAGLLFVGVLAELSLPLAIGWLVIALGVVGARLLRRSRTTSALDADLDASVYRSLSDQGARTASDLIAIGRAVLFVIVWFVIAAAAAIAVSAVSVNLPQSYQFAAGLAILIVFLGILVGGPLWTIRRLR